MSILILFYMLHVDIIVHVDLVVVSYTNIHIHVYVLYMNVYTKIPQIKTNVA